VCTPGDTVRRRRARFEDFERRSLMNPTSAVPHPEDDRGLLTGIIKRTMTVAAFLVFNALLLFVAAGSLRWIWAWIYLGICVLSLVINGAFLLRTSPETIAERGRGLGQTKAWDRLVASLWAFSLYLALPLVSGLDARFGWSGEIAVVVHSIGAVVLALGLGLAGWAMIANAYFSTAVRIQSERGHAVCRSGPYQFVRHPGYVGFILQSLGTPLLLGSLWALIPGLTTVVLAIIRTSLEDRMLQVELPGYSDFVREVRYRLLPGVW
jgi:protein-S-isoprenylcysteine O-methyltransferase Ste14